MALRISSALIAILLAQARRAGADECCGLLCGPDDAQIKQVIPARNVASDRQHYFEIDPVALIAAERASRRRDPVLIGTYHSHPNGLTQPSATDAQLAADDGRIWLIIANDSVTAWRNRRGGILFDRFDPVPLIITDAP